MQHRWPGSCSWRRGWKSVFFHLRHYPEDAEDVFLLLCALNGEATHLVSYDPHLLGLRPFYGELQICPALEFLQVLRQAAARDGGEPLV